MFPAKAKPVCSFQVTEHHPLLHLSTSTVEPFGISVTASLVVAGPFRRFVSATVVTGLAATYSADRVRTVAAHSVRRVRCMNLTLSFYDGAPRRTGLNPNRR